MKYLLHIFDYPFVFLILGVIYLFIILSFFPRSSYASSAPGYILSLGFYPLSIGISALRTGIFDCNGEVSLKDNPKLGYALTWAFVVIGSSVIISISALTVLALI